jgi:hypothetical protein
MTTTPTDDDALVEEQLRAVERTNKTPRGCESGSSDADQLRLLIDRVR